MTKDERKEQIATILKDAGQPLLISEIARECGLKVTPWLRSILQEMIDAGQIMADIVTLWNGAQGRAYRSVE